MEDVASLKVAQQLNSTINQLYEETIQRLEGAMQSVCNDFHANQYVKVGLWVHALCGALSLLRSCEIGILVLIYSAWHDVLNTTWLSTAHDRLMQSHMTMRS